MRTLTLVSAGLDRPDRIKLTHMERNDQFPRVSLYERELQSDMLNERFLKSVPQFRRAIYRFLPTVIAQVLEAYVIRNQYDVVITWAERLGLPFALLLKLTGARTPHVTLNSWISKPKIAVLLKLVQTHFDRILLWSSVQREYAIKVLKIPEEKITFIKKFADQQFFRPIEMETDRICAVGSEMRDYPTLIEALRGLQIKCHLATGRTRGKMFKTVKALDHVGPLPPNITVGKLDYTQLRNLYARSRFVVVPLLPTETDNGLTCILESMAMGKAVICSRTKGQVDVIREGETGIFVPQGDPIALREAIKFLWERPDLTKAMGRRARKYLEENHSIEQFVKSVRTVVKEVIAEKNFPRNSKYTQRNSVRSYATSSSVPS